MDIKEKVKQNVNLTFEDWLSDQTLENVKKLNLIDLTENQFGILLVFLKKLPENELKNFIFYVLDNIDTRPLKIKDFMQNFSDLLIRIRIGNMISSGEEITKDTKLFFVSDEPFGKKHSKSFNELKDKIFYEIDVPKSLTEEQFEEHKNKIIELESSESAKEIREEAWLSMKKN